VIKDLVPAVPSALVQAEIAAINLGMNVGRECCPILCYFMLFSLVSLLCWLVVLCLLPSCPATRRWLILGRARNLKATSLFLQFCCKSAEPRVFRRLSSTFSSFYLVSISRAQPLVGRCLGTGPYDDMKKSGLVTGTGSANNRRRNHWSMYGILPDPTSRL
jgi:hypothetical protein